MLVLALDTCDSRGSLSMLRNEQVLTVIPHVGGADYSSWILPTAEDALRATGLTMPEIEVLAVAAGPGSFTGVRVGLTTVKAWSEVFGTRIVSVSRLEAIASQASGPEDLVAAFFDAQREQVFGGLFSRRDGRLTLMDQEMVVTPQGFVEFVQAQAAGKPVAWISLDPEKIIALREWSEHAQSSGAEIQTGDAMLAPVVGRLALQRIREGRWTDALALDAEYVRRSDAEIFWKGGMKRGA